jgi:hypothetical protein
MLETKINVDFASRIFLIHSFYFILLLFAADDNWDVVSNIPFLFDHRI